MKEDSAKVDVASKKKEEVKVEHKKESDKILDNYSDDWDLSAKDSKNKDQ